MTLEDVDWSREPGSQESNQVDSIQVAGRETCGGKGAKAQCTGARGARVRTLHFRDCGVVTVIKLKETLGVS